MARYAKHERDRKILTLISRDEIEHYNLWKKISHKEVKPNLIEVYLLLFLAKIIGYAFIIRVFINREKTSQIRNGKIINSFPHLNQILKDERRHEEHLTNILTKYHQRYLNSLFLGLDDAIIELLGLLIGMIILLNDTFIIIMVGIITTFSTAIRAGAFQYLETDIEARGSKNPLIAFFYTFAGFFIAATFLIFPFLLFDNIHFSAAIMLFNSFVLILFFSYYFSVLKNIPFKKNFKDIFIVSYGIALLTFFISLAVKNYLLPSFH